MHNETNPVCPLECAGDSDKVVRENGAKEFPNGGTHNGTYGAIILDK